MQFPEKNLHITQNARRAIQSTEEYVPAFGLRAYIGYRGKVAEKRKNQLEPQIWPCRRSKRIVYQSDGLILARNIPVWRSVYTESVPAMKTRAFICTMLLALCHVRMRAQALTMQFPPDRSGSFRRTAVQSSASSPSTSDSTNTPASNENSPDGNNGQPASSDNVSSSVPIAQVLPEAPTGIPVTIHAAQQEKRGDIYDLRGE